MMTRARMEVERRRLDRWIRSEQRLLSAAAILLGLGLLGAGAGHLIEHQLSAAAAAEQARLTPQLLPGENPLAWHAVAGIFAASGAAWRIYVRWQRRASNDPRRKDPRRNSIAEGLMIGAAAGLISNASLPVQRPEVLSNAAGRPAVIALTRGGNLLGEWKGSALDAACLQSLGVRFASKSPAGNLGPALGQAIAPPSASRSTDQGASAAPKAAGQSGSQQVQVHLDGASQATQQLAETATALLSAAFPSASCRSYDLGQTEHGHATAGGRATAGSGATAGIGEAAPALRLKRVATKEEGR